MRRTKDVIISSEDQGNRDKGKRYLITEMPASQAEEWAIRVFIALARSGADVPDNIEETMAMPMGELARLGFGILSKITFDELKPLLSEMFSCVQLKPDPLHPEIVRPLMEEDIEEVTTRLFLRKEVFYLHVDFLKAAETQSSPTGEDSTAANTHRTRTFRGPLPSSSRKGLPPSPSSAQPLG